MILSRHKDGKLVKLMIGLIENQRREIMILRLITKDLRRKKTMNVILFLFILLATLFITSSVSNMIIILEGTDYYFEQANLPEYMVVTLDDGSGDARIKDFLDEHTSITDVSKS